MYTTSIYFILLNTIYSNYKKYFSSAIFDEEFEFMRYIIVKTSYDTDITIKKCHKFINN